MKKEMTLGEFKTFCEGKNEIRYISDWKKGSSIRFCEEKIDFDMIAVLPDMQTIRLSGKGCSIKFYDVISISVSQQVFGEIETKITCHDNDRGKTENFYIFFAPIKNRS